MRWIFEGGGDGGGLRVVGERWSGSGGRNLETKRETRKTEKDEYSILSNYLVFI